MRRRGAGTTGCQGTLLVTGVSPRPEDATGEQFVTITGVINGPSVNEHVVYQQLAVDVDQWPTMGQLFPVDVRAEQPRQLDIRAADAPAAGVRCARSDRLPAGHPRSALLTLSRGRCAAARRRWSA